MSESQSENDDQDLKDFLAPLHEEVLARGKMLAHHLDESVREKLDAPEGIDELRHELRHAPSLASATAVDIRCAAVISDFFAALDGLVFQKESGDAYHVLLSYRVSIHIGEQHVPTKYFVTRIINTISCEMRKFTEQTVDELFYKLLALVQDQSLSIRDYICTTTENGVRLVHKDGIDHSLAV